MLLPLPSKSALDPETLDECVLQILPNAGKLVLDEDVELLAVRGREKVGWAFWEILLSITIGLLLEFSPSTETALVDTLMGSAEQPTITQRESPILAQTTL
jgi:hypothetical protein